MTRLFAHVELSDILLKSFLGMVHFRLEIS